MGKRPEDRYANLASATATETAAGTLTYAEVATGISLGQGIGLLIDQINYLVNVSTLEDLVATGDVVQMGWFSSKVPSSFSFNDRRIIDMAQLHVAPPIGTPASAGGPFKQPIVHQFFPSLIIAAPRLYLGIQGVSLTGVATVTARLYFRYIELTTKEYLELAETFTLVG